MPFPPLPGTNAKVISLQTSPFITLEGSKYSIFNKFGITVTLNKYTAKLPNNIISIKLGI